MAKHRTLVGLNARNSQFFTEPDYALVARARIETLKMMSHVSTPGWSSSCGCSTTGSATVRTLVRASLWRGWFPSSTR